MDKLNYIVVILGKAEAARQLGLKSPMIITGWEKRRSIPAWRRATIDSLFKKLNKMRSPS